MAKDNVRLAFRLKIIDETRNYILDKIKRNDLIIKKHEKLCRALNYLEAFLIFVSAASECVSISTFAYLLTVLVGSTSSAVRLKICAIIARIKVIVSVAKIKLNTIKVFVSQILVHSYINRHEFSLVNDVLREYDEMKEEIKNPKNTVKYTI